MLWKLSFSNIQMSKSLLLIKDEWIAWIYFSNYSAYFHWIFCNIFDKKKKELSRRNRVESERMWMLWPNYWGGWKGLQTRAEPYSDLKNCIYLLFVWLHWVFVVALGVFDLHCYMRVLSFFSYGMLTLSCGMWDLVPWPGIECRPLALGAQSLCHGTTRDILWWSFLSLTWALAASF